ncbi:TetR/AcrR family transcriptional regulator [Streptococcus himalayensis]|uniref:TetR family transcriptional regulator n=1 Tax=Streptococcus himalayensis TaxID=1888195 RepID=A0A917ECK2_9STRE|nr:TetR-like C-terminal domain-containing protein [Streptococcus himalayensis]GGE23597.1 TetR family transcriptional regulator [Streptococcus himalayensis]
MESNKRQKTKRIIEQAMVELLKHDSFNQISTVQLTETAGISRSSFYTHYRDKYDMIEHYQEKLFHQLEYIFDKYSQDKYQAILEVFEFLAQEALLSALLTENGTKEIQTFLRHKLQIMLAEDLQERFGSRCLSPLETEYSHVYLTNAFFGVCQMWIARGKKESPTQMADFLLKMLE